MFVKNVSEGSEREKNYALLLDKGFPICSDAMCGEPI